MVALSSHCYGCCILVGHWFTQRIAVYDEYIYVITAANEMTAPPIIDTVVTDPNEQGLA